MLIKLPCGSKRNHGRPALNCTAINSSWFPKEPANISKPSRKDVLNQNLIPVKKNNVKFALFIKYNEYCAQNYFECLFSNLSMLAPSTTYINNGYAVIVNNSTKSIKGTSTIYLKSLNIKNITTYDNVNPGPD